MLTLPEPIMTLLRSFLPLSQKKTWDKAQILGALHVGDWCADAESWSICLELASQLISSLHIWVIYDLLSQIWRCEMIESVKTPKSYWLDIIL